MGLLQDAPARVERIDLARDFVLDRLLDEAKRVQILDFGFDAELGRAFAAAPRR